MTLDLQHVARRPERHCIPDVGHEVPHGLLVVGRDVDVVDAPAVETDQMVVVTREPLAQFVAGDALRAVVGDDHTGIFEDGQRPVQRRERNDTVEILGELGGRAGSIGPPEGSNQRSASRRVAHIVLPESSFHLVVDAHVTLGLRQVQE